MFDGMFDKRVIEKHGDSHERFMNIVAMDVLLLTDERCV
jgi:hypothetical protein